LKFAANVLCIAVLLLPISYLVVVILAAAMVLLYQTAPKAVWSQCSIFWSQIYANASSSI